MAVTLATYPLPSPAASTAITGGPGGLLWFTATTTAAGGGDAGLIGSIDPTTKAVAEYPIPNGGSNPDGIAAGPDGALWFADPGTNAIGRLDPTTHAIVEYPLSTASAAPAGIAAGPDGNLWFTEYNTGQIGVINPTTHAIAEFPTPTTTSQPEGIVAGPDGGLWFAETGGQAIGRIDPTTKAVTTFQTPFVGLGFQSPTGPIAAGADGNLYFGAYEVIGTRDVGYTIDSFNPTTHVTASYGVNYVSGIAPGPNGKIYFTESREIGEFDPTTHAVDDSLAIPSPSVNQAIGITAGPDGNLWFTDGAYIGRATILPQDQDTILGTLGVGVGSTLPVTSNRTIYVDVNGDGTFDAGDPSAVTDANGQFSISDVPPGSYNLRVATLPGDVASTLTVTPTGGQLIQNQNLLIQPTSALLPLSIAAAPFGASNPDVTTAEVTALYNIVLGRAPDAPGLAAWVGAIKQGTPYATVAYDFLHSTAYYDRVIAADYQTFAGRTPAPSEVDLWAGLMQQGYSEEQIAYLMLTSPGVNALHPDDGSFVQSLYNDLLGRQASGAEVASWTSFLAGGASRAAVVSLFLRSSGAAQRAVDGLYATFLGRAADPSGAAFYTSGLEGSATLADVALAFLTSKEYLARADATVTA